MKKRIPSLASASSRLCTQYSDRRITYLRSALLLGFLLSGIFLPAVESAAQAQSPEPAVDSPVAIKIEPAFEGNFKYGEWLPIYVELENNGSDLDATLRIPIQSSSGTIVYAASVELPAGAKKRLPIYVLPNNFTRQIDLELYAGEVLIGSERFGVHPNPNVNFLVGLISPQRGALSLDGAERVDAIEDRYVRWRLSAAPSR